MTNDTAGIIERLEKATVPDREIDVRIWWVVMTPDFRAFFDSTGYITQVVEREWEAGSLLGLFYNSSETPPDRFDRAPHYTSSIDAALTLVPEGWRWKLGYSKHVPCVAELVDYTPKAIGATCGECDSNHAIALCIAALRSRSNKGEG